MLGRGERSSLRLGVAIAAVMVTTAFAPAHVIAQGLSGGGRFANSVTRPVPPMGSDSALAQRGIRAHAVPRAVPRAADSASVRVCAGGDVSLGSNLPPPPPPPGVRARRGAARRRAGQRTRASRPPPRTAANDSLPDPDSLLAPLVPLVADADLLLVNVEGAIGEGPATHQKCKSGSSNCFAFRQPAGTAAALRSLLPNGVVAGNVANNHAHDAGDDGFAHTLDLLRDAGVAVTGVDTLPTLVPTASGLPVALLGFSTSAGPDPHDLDAVRRAVARAAAITPWVIVTMHMGAEGVAAQRTRDTTEMYLGLDRGNVVEFAHAAVDAGARLVLGHGPHVVRAFEWRNGALIAYSLGNLVTYGSFSMDEPLDRGVLACATVDTSGTVTDAVLRSTVQRTAGILEPDWSGRAAALADSLTRLDFPQTGARFLTETLVLPPEGAAGGAAVDSASRSRRQPD